MRSVSGNRYVSVAVGTRPSIERNGLHQLKEHIYSVEPEASLLIGKRSLGNISNYYTGEVINDEEVAAIQAAAEKHDVNVMNTRYVMLFKKTLRPKLCKGPQNLPNRVYPQSCLLGGSAICQR